MHDFTVLVLRGAFASSVATTLDILGAAAAVAPRLKRPVPRWRVVGVETPFVALGNGMQVPVQPLPRRPRADASTWIVPGLGTETVEAIETRLAQPDAQSAAAAIRAQLACGGSVAAGCSAVFLLQACGALAGRRITTSWWLAPALRKLQPDCEVVAERMVCADGPLVTAGAALAQGDLLLHLLRARCGAPLADVVRRVLLLDAREAQAPYALPALLANGDALVARLTARLESGLPNPPSIRDLAAEFAMSERTLARHVRAATGQAPLALLQGVRLHRARQLLESTRLSVEQVAEQVGYGDATALRRLMRRRAGGPPSRFRAQVAAS